MKKIAVITLCLAMLFSLAACRRNNAEPATETTGNTEPITVPTIPDMTEPSSNIPDPTVDSNSTDGTEETIDTDETKGTENNNP